MYSHRIKLEEKLADFSRDMSFAETLLGRERSLQSPPVYIFGFSDFGFQVCHAFKHSGITVAGYLDNDPKKIGRVSNGSECFAPSHLQAVPDACVFVAVLDYRNFERIETQLNALGVASDRLLYNQRDRSSMGKDFFHYLTNCVVSTLAPLDRYDLLGTVDQDSELIERVYLQLADERSREILISRIALALCGEKYGSLTKFLHSFSDTVTANVAKYGNAPNTPFPAPEFEFYFNQPFLHFDDHEVYVDVGAEDGNTIVPFVDRLYAHDLKPAHVLALEPDPECFDLLQRRLGGCSDVTLYNVAAGKAAGSMSFTPSAMLLGSRACGYSSEVGTLEVDVVDLDSFIGQEVHSKGLGKCSFIKLDPNGNVIMNILEGAQQVIESDHPKIIAGAYHSIDMLYKIPHFLMNRRFGYKVYLRHLAFHANEVHAFAV